MNKLYLLVLLVATAACQHQAPQNATAATAEPTAAPDPNDSDAAKAAQVAADTTLTAPMRALLQQHDLAPLWASRSEGQPAKSALEGFYGTSPYRISFYFSQVVRDVQEPTLFHVTGLNRYHRVITPFTGTIRVQAVQPFADSMHADVDSTARCFTATARFVLREDPRTKGAGNYAGTALLDFYVDAQGRIDQAMMLDGTQNPTQGCGLLFRGTQTSNQTGRRQPVAFAGFYGAVVPDALLHLGLGDRSDEVNPNLARLGWNEAWENDEWWAASPKPKLSL
ncbi:MAG: hypothetical protein M3Y54_04820 [Bacteroidota bacterium]|nr:hypothetical protein [Bacteroidota bacterium]